MKRKIIRINEEKCSGCGLCANACHEGAIGIVNGKAVLLREDFCDGLGDCLPACPMGAITFEEREAPAYDASAVQASRTEKAGKTMPPAREAAVSRLRQWPCQIRLVPVTAPYYDNAYLLIAADCTAYAYADLHRDFMDGRVTLIGCPKLDNVDYSDKLAEIFRENAIAGITLLRMQVPCCGGLVRAVQTALLKSGKHLPLQIVTLSPTGEILS